MKNINKDPFINIESYERITDYWVEIYQSERIKNPELSYKSILKIILDSIKIYCENKNFSFQDYKDYGIREKIHFWLLAKNKLSKIIIWSMTVIHSDILKLLSDPYNEDVCLKLIELKNSIKTTRDNSLNLKQSRLKEYDNIRQEKKTLDKKLLDNNKDKPVKKIYPFFINYNKIDLDFLTNDEKKSINLIVKRIETEKVDFNNSELLYDFLETLPKKWDIKGNIVDFIITQCK